MKETQLKAPNVIILDSMTFDEGASLIDAGGQLNWLYAGKPMVNHIVDELASIGTQTVLLLSDDKAPFLYKSLLNVFRWDTRMTIEAFNYQLTKDEVLMNFAGLAAESGLLIIESHRLRSHSIQAFLNRAYQEQNGLIEAVANGERVGLTLVKVPNATKENLNQIELDGVRTAKQTSVTAFHKTNFEVLNGKFRGLLPRIKARDNKISTLIQHRHSHLHHSVKRQGQLFIEGDTVVQRGGVLHDVILNKNCFIEPGVSMKNCIVLPNTRVRRDSQFKNSVIGEFGVVGIVRSGEN